jgi:hypothetical protein
VAQCVPIVPPVFPRKTPIEGGRGGSVNVAKTPVQSSRNPNRPPTPFSLSPPSLSPTHRDPIADYLIPAYAESCIPNTYRTLNRTPGPNTWHTTSTDTSPDRQRASRVGGDPPLTPPRSRRMRSGGWSVTVGWRRGWTPRPAALFIFSPRRLRTCTAGLLRGIRRCSCGGTASILTRANPSVITSGRRSSGVLTILGFPPMRSALSATIGR